MEEKVKLEPEAARKEPADDDFDPAQVVYFFGAEHLFNRPVPSLHPLLGSPHKQSNQKQEEGEYFRTI